MTQRALDGVEVGDVLFLRNANEHHGRRTSTDDDWTPPEVTITKVGPKRVMFSQYGRDTYAKIEDGRVDDWSRLQTKASFHDEKERRRIVGALNVHGIQLNGRGRTIPTPTLGAIVDMLEGRP